MAPHAMGFSVDFVNEFFDPQRAGYDGERYLAALSDPEDQTRTLTDRINALGLLDGQPEEVSEALMGWFALWPRATGVQVVRLLLDAVSSDPPRRALFIYRQTDAPVEVARADFPSDPLVVIIVRGLHP